MKITFSQEHPNQKLTLKKMQENKYPFLDSDVPKFFDEFLELKLIELLKMKRTNEAERTNDPNYCKYHQLVSHPLEKCFIFNNKIMQLANEKIVCWMMK